MTPKQCEEQLQELLGSENKPLPTGQNELKCLYAEILWYHHFQRDQTKPLLGKPLEVSFCSTFMEHHSYDDFFYCVTPDGIDFIEYVMGIITNSNFVLELDSYSLLKDAFARTLLMANMMKTRYQELWAAAYDIAIAKGVAE